MQRLKSPLWLLALLGLFWNAMAHATDYPDFVTLVEKYSPAVVSIQTKSEPKERSWRNHPPIPDNSPFRDYFKKFFEQLPEAPSRPQNAVGSGFIISPDGYIVTNAHVVEDTDRIVVGLYDRTELTAQVIGKDSRSDIALLKVKPDGNLPAVRIGDINKLKVGQWVLAIGSPFGFERSATQGIISALARSLPSDNYVPFIQTDAAVNPGNSGGPLFNLDGEVIGVNSQIYSRSGGYQGISFAIPIDVAMDVVDQLKNGGKVSRGWLGVLIQEVTPELAQSFNLSKPNGALIGQVMADSPAQKAGLKAGDIIVTFNGQPVHHSSDLPLMVGRTRPGAAVTLVVIREGKEQTLTIQIEELPEDSKQLQQAIAEPTASNRLGLTIAELGDDQREKNEPGVLVKSVDDGPAADAGIRAGDVIVRLNNVDVRDPSQFATLVKQLPTGRPIPVLIRRENGSLFLALTVPEKE
ncbi:MAG TPA: DegQ family serine endoprotease [Candidatus Competibacteraceae bacterium]|nr:MAG: DegQ family serine endoprotease [Candidatus Competibacteraceae bacterium]HOB62360.1 DegQ family serine endoprotease [Candidatus Competibacteraceae bacterium]HQA26500.1 DegQ family serine endoprotease [Candidatus Competibacteraceae bacterium]HQD56326.1 DegQ family serine endoprotease [Candidatus Competibacteraceae bacterium]